MRRWWRTAGLFWKPSDGPNRRPPLYEGGPVVKGRFCSHRPVKAGGWGVGGEQRSSLYRLLVGGLGWMGGSLR
jgi:hypothetical protein